jgi:integrase/recombinase XerD
MMQLIDSYLAVRRAVGFELRITEFRLRSFGRYALERGDTCLRAETAVAWAGTASSRRERYFRIRTVVLFACHLRAEDPEHEMPPGDVYPATSLQRRPHIYSDLEIRLILDAAGRLGPAGTSRADTYRTLFALLAVTGLRISEALALQLGDLTADGLVIRNTKFRKSRLVPIHSTTRAALTAYQNRWRVVANAADPVFVSARGTALVDATVHGVFDRIVRRLGMRVDPLPGSHRRPSPCLHDFRHTLAVRTLEECPAARATIGRHMLALSTYLGHSKLSATFWYLHSTPELMVDIADACESFLGGAGR